MSKRIHSSHGIDDNRDFFPLFLHLLHFPFSRSLSILLLFASPLLLSFLLLLLSVSSQSARWKCVFIEITETSNRNVSFRSNWYTDSNVLDTIKRNNHNNTICGHKKDCKPFCTFCHFKYPRWCYCRLYDVVCSQLYRILPFLYDS